MANAHEFGFHASLGKITAANTEIRTQIENVGITLARIEGGMPDAEVATSCMMRIVELTAASVVLAERHLEVVAASAERSERAMTAMVLGERLLELLALGVQEQRERAMPLLERAVLALETIAWRLEPPSAPTGQSERQGADADPDPVSETGVRGPESHAGQRGGTGKKKK